MIKGSSLNHLSTTRLVTALVALGVLTACGPAQPAASPVSATDPTLLVADTEISIPNPTVTPVTPLPENLPPGLPADFTPNELAAAQLGQAAYSGYACSFNEDNSCVCDQPSIQSVTFTFQPGNKLIYQFTGDTYSAQWEMTRLSPDQWSYTLSIGADESGATPGNGGGYFFVMTLTETGFALSQREDKGGGQIITCPDVVFTRMAP